MEGDDLNHVIQRMRPLSEKQEKIISGNLQSSYLVLKQKTQTFSDFIAMQTLRGLRLLNSSSSDGVPKDFEMSVKIF